MGKWTAPDDSLVTCNTFDDMDLVRDSILKGDGQMAEKLVMVRFKHVDHGMFAQTNPEWPLEFPIACKMYKDILKAIKRVNRQQFKDPGILIEVTISSTSSYDIQLATYRTTGNGASDD